MPILKIIATIGFYLAITNICFSQTKEKIWNGKKCAVVLTYDDALDEHLDKVVPALDSLSLKGTFYLIATAPAVKNRENEWQIISKNGHELGNHTFTHPCDGSLPDRNWVNPEKDLSKYTVERAVEEIRQTNKLLKNIDQRADRTFAYPCGDLYIGDTLFYDYIKNDFIAARGVKNAYSRITDIDLSNIYAFSQVESSAEQMIELVKEAEKKESLIVFIFHGVGGGHSLNVDLEEHRKLLSYLSKNQKDIWVAPMIEVAKYIKKKQNLN